MAKQLFRSIRSCRPLLVAFIILVAGTSWQTIPAPTQAQVAYRFLRELLRADYPAAYRRLAPEVRATLPLPAFLVAARPLQLQGQLRGQEIDFYTFGTHLSEQDKPEPWFYRFSFAQDSLQKLPPILLEVTFRDTTARQVLGFRVQP